jgi:hypothetical protein
MAQVLPKIVYTPLETTSPVTLNFSRPPRRATAYNSVAARHDNISTAGVREVVIERVDNFLEFEMEWVALGADVAAWDSFMQQAIQGVEFDYYPDASLPSYTTYTLEQGSGATSGAGGTDDIAWRPEYKSAGQYTYTLVFRQVLT